jgi:hypothetical protein
VAKEKRRLTEAEQRAWEAEMKAAGITVVNPEPGTGTITLLRKRSTEEMLAQAKAAGVEVTVTENSTGGEITALPGIRERAPRMTARNTRWAMVAIGVLSVVVAVIVPGYQVWAIVVGAVLAPGRRSGC